jgi:hypothetical protein
LPGLFTGHLVGHDEGNSQTNHPIKTVKPSDLYTKAHNQLTNQQANHQEANQGTNQPISKLRSTQTKKQTQAGF